MSAIALYRKYRSASFEAVLGQAHVTKTLTAQLKQGRVSHAYLFTGPRGTGKTTVARLLARSLNCTGEPKPCGKCPNCRTEIGSHLDLIEIDAASNRRIDEIRDLREKIRSAPSLGKFKVYIIDEVHMLTNEAANALLKTLEEPPAHAVFILATTEAHKLPETIISRTQRFNFKPINLSDLEAGLKQIASSEQAKIQPGALKLIASAGTGSFRDAIGILDQVIGLVSGEITVDVVRQVLGWAPMELVEQLSVALFNGESGQALELVDLASTQGTAAEQLITQLIRHQRNLMLQAVEAKDGTANTLARSISVLMQAAKSNWPEIGLELGIVQLGASSPVPPPSAEPSQPVTEIQPKNQPATLPVRKTVAETLAPDRWMKVLMIIQRQNNPLYSLIMSCAMRVEADQLKLTARYNFHRERLMEPKNRQLIESAVEKVTGQKLLVVCEVEQPAPQPVSANAELVSSALEILGGEIVDE